MNAPTPGELAERAEAAKKREARYAAMTDESIATERARYEEDLERMSDGRGGEAYAKADSIRLHWKEGRIAEKEQGEADLERMTCGRADVAYFKANSIRFLRQEQERRASAKGN